MTKPTWVYRSAETLTAWLNAQRHLRVHYCEDPPEILKGGTVYLIGQPDKPWCAAMLCPCGCNADIRLSLIASDSPRWKAKRSAGGSVTIHPSVWRTKGCRSHFNIFKGRVIWVRGRRVRAR